MRMILLGPPGSGKGTIAKEISEKYELPHISTGDIFRSNIKEETVLGKEAKSYMDRGDLVPDELTIRLVEDRLQHEDAQKGFILDGFPRTTEQAKALDTILDRKQETLDLALNVYVPQDLILKRLSGRRVCSSCGETYNVYYKPTVKEGICDLCQGEVIQRADDQEETIMNRLNTYEEKTAPLIQFYEESDKVRSVDNSGALEETLAQLKEVLHS